jgi:hypothetical protein
MAMQWLGEVQAPPLNWLVRGLAGGYRGAGPPFCAVPGIRGRGGGVGVDVSADGHAERGAGAG